jgi:hypothetical protein
MNKKGAIIVIEDDPDDQSIFSDVFKELNYNNKIIFLMTDRKHLIICDQHLRSLL